MLNYLAILELFFPLLALSISAPAGAWDCRFAPEANSCPGPQIVDVDGDSTFDAVDNASLDIESVAFTADGGGNLQITMRLRDLSAPAPSEAPAGNWSVYFDSAGTRYIVQANGSSRSPDTVIYTAGPVDGVVAGDGVVANEAGSDPVTLNERTAGSFNEGANNTIVFAVPIARIGNPPAGALLTNLVAGTYLSSDATRSPIVDRAPDTGSGADYEVGTVCIPPAQ